MTRTIVLPRGRGLYLGPEASVTLKIQRQHFQGHTGLCPKYSPRRPGHITFQVRLLITPLTCHIGLCCNELLLLRLERQFGLRGIVLDWFRSYLSVRSFRVALGGHTSSIIYIICSVPLGSVL